MLKRYKFEFMKLTSFALMGFLLTATLVSGADNTDASNQVGMTSPKTKHAEIVMLHACQREFPSIVAGKSLDDVDRWAEAQENSQNPTQFKRSRCFATHEIWEKLAQRNEWAVTNIPGDRTRMPASANTTSTGSTTTTK